jgi:hypothetical protein
LKTQGRVNRGDKPIALRGGGVGDELDRRNQDSDAGGLQEGANQHQGNEENHLPFLVAVKKDFQFLKDFSHGSSLA